MPVVRAQRFSLRLRTATSCVGLAFVVLLPALLSACSRPAPPPEPVRAVRTLLVAPASVGGVHEYAAELRARTESRLGFQVPDVC
jgi:multidrug efflux system membrane fusion protein